jgi:hypothetical protein
LSNPFTDQAGVATYDRARPYFHSRIAARSKQCDSRRAGRSGTEPGVERWLRETLAPLFTGPTGTFEYDGLLKVCQKIA